ncbi:DUF2550 domain-containing protein [Propionimicrobium sp. PCR01-08-3]|uniref:DUF2550 domain-containing protein n=1 Tax=Propionimicrobium sp. PCR01-08-3 TaxID=3052086 RepID=UPI00255CD85C|nr:DUF2550 domain-containing protein [Propionimicrobium sp. PCR01-08-3]WIY83824.1 DUF2550 domain-containing protein [Propionimicrobium sp. PCR01-08-3]
MGDLDGLSGGVALILLIVICCLLLIFVRRLWLNSQGGLFDCGLHKAGTRRWRAGLARYSGERFEWYLLWRIGPKPSRVFVRSRCEVVGIRKTSISEANLGYAFSTILSVRVPGDRPGELAQVWDLVLNEGSATGLVSWLEAAPPGHGGYLRRVNG